MLIGSMSAEALVFAMLAIVMAIVMVLEVIVVITVTVGMVVIETIVLVATANRLESEAKAQRFPRRIAVRCRPWIAAGFGTA
jgi:hypothetical protein